MSALAKNVVPLDAPPAPGAAPAGKLLIVDDLADNRAVLTRRFQRRGFEIVEATCGADALDLVRRHEFDAILLDVMMPGMSGTEVLRELRKEFDASRLPVIMVTAKSQSEDVVEALQLGANDYVTKPVDFAVALARVAAQIERRRSELGLRNAAADLVEQKSTLESEIEKRGAKLSEANKVIQDEVARRVASEETIAYLAHHDTLTGLANRFSFDGRLAVMRDEARAKGSQLSLLFIDLDGFKMVNDTLGHMVGDALLQEVAGRLKDVVSSDDFCARIGGDEFAIIHMSDNPRATAADLAQAVIMELSGRHVVKNNQVYVGASIGISVLYGGDSDAATMLREADLAMYQAKADGRGVYRFFGTEMSRQADLRRNLENDLRDSVDRKHFELYYQPIVDLKTQTVGSVEALMRWNHPTRGFVPPSDFVPLAEETGLIVPLGAWAIQRACFDAASWRGDLRVAVNLSPVQFRSPNLVSTVEDALMASGLSPERLEFEITEGVLLGNSRKNLDVLNGLRALGVRISLDDFGTGYSGLSYFRNFKFDKVKIDQSFVRSMETNPECMAIVRAAVGLGASLGIRTTAEGVETLEQLNSVIDQGCTEVQGYFFSIPQPQSRLMSAIDRIAEMIDESLMQAGGSKIIGAP
ncbi:MAG TPA: EAL domain-containing protein [Rhodoblastus sp.]|nr:EAL domain-containing protein [Rhodoblastus sp.]